MKNKRRQFYTQENTQHKFSSADFKLDQMHHKSQRFFEGTVLQQFGLQTEIENKIAFLRLTFLIF